MISNIEEQLKEEGVFVTTTSGTSMIPMLRDRRDRVILVRKGSERLKKYDVPIYLREDGNYILHRVIGVRDGYYLIRGDHTYSIEKIPEEKILGVMTEFYRGKKHILATQKCYRFYARLWNFIYPLRSLLHRIHLLLFNIRQLLIKKR